MLMGARPVGCFALSSFLRRFNTQLLSTSSSSAALRAVGPLRPAAHGSGRAEFSLASGAAETSGGTSLQRGERNRRCLFVSASASRGWEGSDGESTSETDDEPDVKPRAKRGKAAADALTQPPSPELEKALRRVLEDIMQSVDRIIPPSERPELPWDGLPFDDKYRTILTASFGSALAHSACHAEWRMRAEGRAMLLARLASTLVQHTGASASAARSAALRSREMNEYDEALEKRRQGASEFEQQYKLRLRELEMLRTQQIQKREALTIANLNNSGP